MKKLVFVIILLVLLYFAYFLKAFLSPEYAEPDYFWIGKDEYALYTLVDKRIVINRKTFYLPRIYKNIGKGYALFKNGRKVEKSKTCEINFPDDYIQKDDYALLLSGSSIYKVFNNKISKVMDLSTSSYSSITLMNGDIVASKVLDGLYALGKRKKKLFSHERSCCSVRYNDNYDIIVLLKEFLDDRKIRNITFINPYNMAVVKSINIRYDLYDMVLYKGLIITDKAILDYDGNILKKYPYITFYHIKNGAIEGYRRISYDKIIKVKVEIDDLINTTKIPSWLINYMQDRLSYCSPRNYIQRVECSSRETTKETAALTNYTIDPVYNFANVVEYRSGMKTTKPYTTNARNQVIQAGQVSVGWDPNGNMMTKSNGYTFHYDFQNRLRQATNTTTKRLKL